MRRDYKTAVKAAVNGLYSKDTEEMEEALKEILEALDPDMAELMEDNEEAARLKVNGEELEDEDEDIDMIVPESFDD